LQLPGVQGELLDELLKTGTPVVLVMMAGRPYALGKFAERLAAGIQSYFPGEEGGPALAAVISGRVNPSGRLPVGVPRSPGGQPATYLSAKLGLRSEVSNIDPTPLWPFGHGLSYTEFRWDDVAVAGQAFADRMPTCPTDGSVEVSLTVTNIGSRAGADVVQLYLHDPVAQVTRPEVRLIGYARVTLEPGCSARVTFAVGADLSAFTGLDGHRIVEPGEIELRLSASSAVVRHFVRLELVGPTRRVDFSRQLVAEVSVQ
jgi:beta-xylosidase